MQHLGTFQGRRLARSRGLPRIDSPAQALAGLAVTIILLAATGLVLGAL